MKQHAYRAYVLRCWQNGKVERGQTPHWHFSLEEILHERRRQGFDDLEALIEFLRAEFGAKREEANREDNTAL